MIEVKFFASFRELVNKECASIPAQPNLTAKQVWQLAAGDISIKNNTLCSINLEYASLDSLVYDHDEVAFFPPVTGG